MYTKSHFAFYTGSSVSAIHKNNIYILQFSSYHNELQKKKKIQNEFWKIRKFIKQLIY